MLAIIAFVLIAIVANVFGFAVPHSSSAWILPAVIGIAGSGLSSAREGPRRAAHRRHGRECQSPGDPPGRAGFTAAGGPNGHTQVNSVSGVRG